MDRFYDLNPILQALLATLFTWFVTALGAGLVIFTKNISQRYLDASLGMAAGVMTAASYWSLLAPSIEMSAALPLYGQALRWLPPLVGFLLGAIVLRIADRLLPHLHPDLREAEGIHSHWRRTTLLIMAITLHNIPEGLAVSAPVYAATGRRTKAFLWSFLSGICEPVGALLAAAILMPVLTNPVMGWALGITAGVMVALSLEELIPTAKLMDAGRLPILGVALGMLVMAFSLWLLQ